MFRRREPSSLSSGNSEAEIAAAIDFVKTRPRYATPLASYLPQGHPVYEGRSANEVIRIRGYLLASFAQTGLPEPALPFALEILEVERNAYLVAAAAVALRGLPSPRPAVLPYLFKAIANIKLVDDAVSFESYRPRWPRTDHTTALTELIRTLEWMGDSLGDALADLEALSQDQYINDRLKSRLRTLIQRLQPRASSTGCCLPFLARLPAYSGRKSRKSLIQDVATLELEDQNERRCTFTQFFNGHFTIVIFFYTRCDNPNKCSLSISRLGALQRALADEGLAGQVKTAAITYDPAFDQPFRLKTYCEKRGMRLDHDNCAFRLEKGLPTLLRFLGSGVNYVESVVNQHTTELYILDPAGNLVHRFQQLQWQIPEVLAQLKNRLARPVLLRQTAGPTRHKLTNLLSAMLPVPIIFFPKCPLCWAAYLSVLGITNLQVSKWTYWMLPMFVTLLCFSLLALYKLARRRQRIAPFCLTSSGFLCVLVPGLFLSMRSWNYVGIGLVLLGSIANCLDDTLYSRLRLLLRRARS